MRATILIPTHNHGRLIHGALRSVLRQTAQDFEVFIIGDGVTEETRAAVNEALGWDNRLQFIDREKSPRTGELYRHEILTRRASGDVYCCLSDDDLWLPRHLETLCQALERADVSHSRWLRIPLEGPCYCTLADWSMNAWRRWTLERGQSAVGLSTVGQTLDSYRRLPHGWRTAPKGWWTDHYMWAQILAEPWIKASCTGEITTLNFPSPLRKEMSLDARIAEMSAWENRMVSDLSQLERDIADACAAWTCDLEGRLVGTELAQRHTIEALRCEQEQWAAEREKLIVEARLERDQWRRRFLASPRILKALNRWVWRMKGLPPSVCDHGVGPD